MIYNDWVCLKVIKVHTQYGMQTVIKTCRSTIYFFILPLYIYLYGFSIHHQSVPCESFWCYINPSSCNGLVSSGNRPYLKQCWPRFMSPYAVTRPQWINHKRHSHQMKGPWSKNIDHLYESGFTIKGVFISNYYLFSESQRCYWSIGFETDLPLRPSDADMHR